jgi:hypothetical protein
MFHIKIDTGESQFSLDYTREGEAWAEFWKQVSQMDDDGLAMRGFDPQFVLASRTGVNQPRDASGAHRWYVHLVKESS